QHMNTRLLAAPADIQGGDAVAEETPSGLSLGCAVGGCETLISSEIPAPEGPGLHYKTRSGLRRSGISSPSASRIRFGSPIGRATRRSVSVWPSVVSSSMSPMAI